MQSPAIRIAKEMSLEVIIVDGNKDAEFAKCGDKFLHIDLKDKELIADAAVKLKTSGGLHGIFTAGTDFSASVAYAAEKAGLPGIPYEIALNASDKARMRACFEKAGVRSPKFSVVEKDNLNSVTLTSFPLVVKPVDNMGGRGCRKVGSRDELKSALEDAVKFSRSGRVIVEDYMDGPEYSIDSIVYDGKITICGIADRHIFFPPYFIEMGHTIPSALDDDAREHLVSVFEQGVRSLGITMGAAKGDVKLTKDGAAIGEIAARLSGGYMSGWTYPYSSGVELTRAAILIALGKKPQNTKPLFSKTSAERAFISIPGIIHFIKNAENAENLEHIENIFLRVGKGSIVDFPVNNVSKCGNVIACAAQRVDAVNAAEHVVKEVLFALECPNAITENFLNGTVFNRASSRQGVEDVEGVENFPPDAFTVSSSIKEALSKLPQSRIVCNAHTGKPAIVGFKAFVESGLTDYVGRTVEESLDAVRSLSGLELPVIDGELPDDCVLFAREFWQALIRGGYQGGAYMIEKSA
ncbi:hypothetical protein FACS1894102_4210 [Spirochaetia bacterium]|nr:hypothetical protein FACS1894102_4210 [Spirochaetia bacterium]